MFDCVRLCICSAVVTGLLSGQSGAQEAPLVRNGGFEQTSLVAHEPTRDIGFGVWSLGEERLVPGGWSLNEAFPGTLEMVNQGAFAGTSALRIKGTGTQRPAQVYQPCPEVVAGKAYLVSAWVRGGPVSIGFYEYYEDGVIRTPTVMTSTRVTPDWREVRGYYTPTGAGFRSASVAIIAPRQATVEVDEVRIEPARDARANAEADPVVLETDLLRMVVAPNGELQEFTCKATGRNYALQGSPVRVFSAFCKGGELPVSFIFRQGDVLDLRFVDPELRVSLKVDERPEYLTLTLREVSGGSVEWVGLCNLQLDISGSVGTLINAAWDSEFSACVLACNHRTHSFGAGQSRASLMARCYEQFGMQGARVAIIGAPLKPAGSPDKLLDVIERVELDQGLPHPTINGVWIKRAPERFASYLMAAGASEANIDEVVEFARGGFGCVELMNWWHSTPTYEPNPSLFPRGLEGMKACADKIRAAGMQVGLHAMQAMVGWGGVGMRDSYVSPRADPRLLQTRHCTLAGPIDETATSIDLKEDVAEWPEEGDLFIDGEVVRYQELGDHKFEGCTRGMHGTAVGSYPEGTRAGLLANCFNMWGNVIYAPDVDSTMVDEVCGNIARVFNAVGADMTYFDGGEEIHIQPPRWHNQGRVALGVFDRLDKALVLEGNAIYSHLAWHVISRGSPHFDPIYYGRRGYTLRHKGQNPAGWGRNLLTGDVGWFAPHTHSGSTYAVTPDEVMLLCLKALGGKAPISFQVSCDYLYANKRMPEMLQIIRRCDELKRANYFSDAVCRELSKPMAEHTLAPGKDGGLEVRPLEFGPTQLVKASEGHSTFSYANPHQVQRPWLRLRALSRLAPYGSEENLVLADPAEGMPFAAAESTSPDLTCEAQAVSERTPAGSAAFRFYAKNDADARSGWCRTQRAFDAPMDLSAHRRVGVWIRGEDKGGVLNVQLVQGHGFRDHYVDLDYSGWRYHELATAESDRYYDYQWPHNWVSLLYWVFRYSQVKGINLLYSGLPANSEVNCVIGRIEALREYNDPLVSPSLEANGRRMTFPTVLRPDEYIELDWEGTCRHFEPNGGVLGNVAPHGEMRLEAGDTAVAFSCGGQGDRIARAEVTLAVRGAALKNAAPGARSLGAGVSSDESDDRLRLLPTRRRGLRLVRGRYERVGRDAARSIAAFDGKANVWTVDNGQAPATKAAIIVHYDDGQKAVVPKDAEGAVVETFGDPAAYDVSQENKYADYVVGPGRELLDCGPVRQGVTQSLTLSGDTQAPGRARVRYVATNKGAPGGWCGKGRRFPQALDLSSYEALAMWVKGDGQGQDLKVQFRDAEGRYADWVIPIRFNGWQQSVYVIPQKGEFDWSRVEYVILYYNSIPAGKGVAVLLGEMRAFARLTKAPPAMRPTLLINGQQAPLADRLLPGEALVLDHEGRRAIWRPGMAQSEPIDGTVAPAVLGPDMNRLELRCDVSDAAPAGIAVRVVRLGPDAP